MPVATPPARPRPMHLAIMREPYLSRVLDGSKTIESRWLHTRRAPYGRLQAGDQIAFKRSGGSILAVASAVRVEQYADLTPAAVIGLLQRWGSALQLTDRDCQ